MPDEMNTPKRPRDVHAPSLRDAMIPVVALIVLLVGAYLLFGDRAAGGANQIALLTSALIVGVVAIKNGMTAEALQKAALEGVSSGLGAVFILLAVGSLIGTWAMSGTIVAMVYYGLEILSPDYFYASAAVLCALVATCIGSSWTVAGTLGIGLMGIAANMGLSPAITAGAVISGAYFGDKASPLSDTVNLAIAATGAELFQHIRETLWTSVPALVISLGIFALLGSRGDFDASTTTAALEAHFNITPWSFLPLILVLALAVLKCPPFVTIFLGAFAGAAVAVVINPSVVVAFAGDPHLPRVVAMVKGVWMALATGYHVDTGEPAIDGLLSRGGMSSMLNTVWLIMSALAFGSVIEHAGLLARVVEPILKTAHSVGRLIVAIVVSCVAINIVAADQYIAVMLPARMFRAEIARRGLSPVVLSRAVGDSAPVSSALIPWNSCGAYMAATLGVATLSYAPFTFFCLLNPLMTILIGMLGLRMVRAGTQAAVETVG